MSIHDGQFGRAVRAGCCRASFPLAAAALSSPRVLAAIGLVFAWQASLLDFGGFDLPGPGFFPLVLGILVFAFATLIGIEGLRGAAEGETVELGHRDVLIVLRRAWSRSPRCSSRSAPTSRSACSARCSSW